MQKLSPLMKGLVETRARADAGLQNALKSVAHRTKYLNQLTTTFERKAAQLNRSINNANHIANEALRIRQACDQFISKLKDGIDPSCIEPIDGWQGRYGPRGALGNAVQQVVEAAYPREITTEEVAASIHQSYSLTFETPAERKEWKRVSILGRLGYLCRTGRIERLHDPKSNSGQTGTWRWIPTDQPFADLQALATQAGICTTFALDQDQLEFASMLEPTPEEDDIPR